MEGLGQGGDVDFLGGLSFDFLSSFSQLGTAQLGGGSQLGSSSSSSSSNLAQLGGLNGTSSRPLGIGSHLMDTATGGVPIGNVTLNLAELQGHSTLSPLSSEYTYHGIGPGLGPGLGSGQGLGGGVHHTVGIGPTQGMLESVVLPRYSHPAGRIALHECMHAMLIHLTYILFTHT